MTIQTEARNATLQDLAAMLRVQQDLQLDAVVTAPASAPSTACCASTA